MNEIAGKFLLAVDKFMLETHLRQPGFTCSACETFKGTMKTLKKRKSHNIFVKKN